MGQELTPEEQQFFATGDSNVLGLSEESAEAAKPAEEAKPAEVAAPAPEAPDPVLELQNQLAVERASRVQLEQSLARLAETSGKLPEVQAKVPDPATDPLGAMLHQINEVSKTVAKLQETTAEQQKVQTQQQQFTEFVQNLSRMRDEFAKTQPDFADAYAHLRARKMEDYRDVGVPEYQIQQALMQDELAVSQNAIAKGKNPAAAIYNMAKRYGYTSKAAPAATANPAEKVATLKKGEVASVNPAKGGASVELTFNGLKDASDADLNKLVQDGKLWGNLVGGKNNDIF